MRSLLALVVPALLSLSLIACASDDSDNEPASDVVQNPLVQEGGKCAKNSDCATNRCAIAETIGIRGLPAPCEGNDCGNGQPAPDDSDTPATKGKPTPGSSDAGGVVIYPDPPAPSPAPAPAPSPSGVGVCIAQ